MRVDVSSRRVTMADVAREAGVSATTVSYVLNNAAHQKIPEGTRERVLEAAGRLAYAPSAAARALRTGRTNTVLGLLPDWPIGPTLGALVEHLSAALTAHGLMLMVHPRTGQTRPISDVWKEITPAAVLAFEDFTREEVSALRTAGIEYFVAGLGSSSRGRSLGMHEQRIGSIQVQHLAAAGHRLLGYAYPDDERVRSFARPRLEGFQQACLDLNLETPTVLTIPLDPAGAAEAVNLWRDADRRITAVGCYNDNSALAVLAGMRVLSLKAPQDLALIGVDDIEAARLADPPLTTVVTDLESVATRIAEAISAALTGETRRRHRSDPETVHLVRRSSA